MPKNPIPVSAPPIWDTVKLMFSLRDAYPSLREHDKKASFAKDKKKKEKEQPQLEDIDSPRSHNVF